MSTHITESFAQQFADTFKHVAQQNKSRLEPAVTVEPGIRGASKTINRMGQRIAKRRTARHSETPINNQPHSGRVLELADWEDGDMIDEQDKIRLLTDPTSDYVKAMVQSMNRAKDEMIINALKDNARTTSGNSSLPASQKIANANSGLTKSKIFQAARLFRKNECDAQAGEEVCMVYHSQALIDILSDTQLTSADFTAVQMIQTGSLTGKWMGFDWIPSERLPKNGSNRLVYAFAKSGLVLGMGENVTVRVAEDPSHGFSTRIYSRMSIGAVRLEEEKVVEISCKED